MKIGKVEIPHELETIVQKALDRGYRIIDTTDATIWDFTMGHRGPWGIGVWGIGVSGASGSGASGSDRFGASGSDRFMGHRGQTDLEFFVE